MKKCIKCGQVFAKDDWECPACSYSPIKVDGYISFAPVLSAGNEHFDSAAFSELAKYEGINFWFRARNKLIVSLLQRYFSTCGKLLEIGCGTGYVLANIEKRFPYLEVYGSEIYTEGLRFADSRLTSASLFQMDAQDIPFYEEFDIVCAFDVLEHIENDALVLQQMYEAVRPGGGILVTVPQHRFLWSQADEFSCHVRRYERKELVDKVAAAGFRIVNCGSFVSVLLPLMMISRLMHSKKKVQIKDELNLNPVLNSLLEKALDMERIVINKDIKFPFGGSLFLCATKE